MVAEHRTILGVYGPGTHTDETFVPVPQDTKRIFKILASETPGFNADAATLDSVTFEGDDFPVIPGPLKAVSVAASLHAMAGVVANEILTQRGIPHDNKVTVNTTHAAFWLATIGMGYVGGKDIVSIAKNKELDSIVPSFEQGWYDTFLKYKGTSIYPTKNPEVWYQIHGSLDAVTLLKAMGLDPEYPCKSVDEAWNYIASYTRTKTPEELELFNIYNGFCGGICLTPEQWNKSEMGRALARHPLIDVQEQKHVIPTPAVPYLPVTQEDLRPLAGIKVVEMTRIIAGPVIGNVLASYGADVIRVNCSSLIDINIMQLTLNAGKRTIDLDIKKPADLQRLKELIGDADIFVQGFRQNKLARRGLSINDIMKLAGDRKKGIVYVSENCYGPDGPFAEKGGWQQLADGHSGASYVTGRSLKLAEHEAVLPSLPISDMTTGIMGALGAMMAIRDRAAHGGSYTVHASLTAVNTRALSADVGLYPEHVVADTARRFQWGPMRAADHVFDLLFTVYDGWTRVFPKEMSENGGWMQSFAQSAFGHRLSFLKPVARLGSAECSAEWKTPSVPYCYEDAYQIRFR